MARGTGLDSAWRICGCAHENDEMNESAIVLPRQRVRSELNGLKGVMQDDVVVGAGAAAHLGSHHHHQALIDFPYQTSKLLFACACVALLLLSPSEMPRKGLLVFVAFI